MSLKTFGARFGVTWPHDLWQASSAYAHQLMPQRQAVSTGSGLQWGGPVPLADRRKLLDWSVKTFLNFYQLLLDTIAPAQVADLRVIATSKGFA
jgi:hypothetical protein